MHDNTVTLRPCREEDAPHLWRLNKEAFGYDYPLEQTRLRLAELLENPAHRLFVAEEAGRVVGYVHGSDYQCSYSDPLKNIMAIAVEPSTQGKGVGRLLLQAIEGWARDTGCAGVRLVSGENRQQAHGFYLHCGYTLRKLQKNFVKRF